MTSAPCFGCSETPSYYSKKCAECGYKFASLPGGLERENALTRLPAARGYKLIRWFGVSVSGGAVVPAYLDDPIAAVCIFGLGVTIYMTGIVGAWWNEE
jgi:hypothetical protein